MEKSHFFYFQIQSMFWFCCRFTSFVSNANIHIYGNNMAVFLPCIPMHTIVCICSMRQHTWKRTSLTHFSIWRLTPTLLWTMHANAHNHAYTFLCANTYETVCHSRTFHMTLHTHTIASTEIIYVWHLCHDFLTPCVLNVPGMLTLTSSLGFNENRKRLWNLWIFIEYYSIKRKIEYIWILFYA